jgi:ABC-type nickel/cobalt efflux system permease component RcnA
LVENSAATAFLHPGARDMWILTVVFAGVLAGVLHVISGPDHLAAVAPLAAADRTRAWRQGLMWGIGHSSGTWVLAAVALAFREALNVDAISTWSERLVGLVLIAIGIWSLQRALRTRVHIHAHTHDGSTHVHAHTHDTETSHPPHAAQPHNPHSRASHSHTGHSHTHGALGVGTIHGLAGTSHLLGVLPALALPTRTGAVSYVVAFGVGSIIAMTLFAAAVGVLASRSGRLGPRAGQYFVVAASILAMCVGVYWIFVSFSISGHAA